MKINELVSYINEGKLDSALITLYGNDALEGQRARYMEAVKEFAGCGYGQVKEALSEAVIHVLAPLQERVKELQKDKSYIDNVMKTNAERAYYTANKTLRKVKKKIGLTDVR
jgi:tryptophanyl-tRNA synthetase